MACVVCNPSKSLKNLKAHRKTKGHLKKLMENVELNLEKAIEFEDQKDYVPEIFLLFFATENGRVYDNYIQLNKEQGTLNEFLKKPLTFILANEPECCLPLAKEFLKDPFNGRMLAPYFLGRHETLKFLRLV